MLLGWEKRKWCYLQSPSAYGVKCDFCGGNNIDWSEWEKMIWCYDCKIDTRGTTGIFDGTIPINITKMAGIDLGRIYI